jgi:hypothetical protein
MDMLMPTILLSTEYFISILTVKSIDGLNVYPPHIIGNRYIRSKQASGVVIYPFGTCLRKTDLSCKNYCI